MNFSTSRANDSCGVIFQKDIILLTNQFHLSLNLTVNINLYNGILMVHVTFLVPGGVCTRHQKWLQDLYRVQNASLCVPSPHLQLQRFFF